MSAYYDFRRRLIMAKSRHIWWILLLKGIILLLFGLFTIFWPAVTFVTFSLVFAFYILLSGVVNIIYGIIGVSSHRYWFLLLILGIFEIGVGGYAINHLLISITALALLIGFTFLIGGIFEIIIAFDDMFASSHRILQSIGGALSLITGIIVLRYPIRGGIAFAWVLGIYALIAGSMIIALSVMANDMSREVVRKG
jgi:uncharacterized membrane protein HdeD (DUF308 family)